MHLLTNVTTPALWQAILKDAESNCSVALQDDLEAYLIALLMRYTNKPEILRQVVAEAFLKALELRSFERNQSLQIVGDQCLIFTGLFPKIAEKRNVKLRYFVGLGQSAYAAISKEANDLYGSLAMQFVVLMDVLQSIRVDLELEPLEAYEQWDELGSQRALKFLQTYAKQSIPIKKS